MKRKFRYFLEILLFFLITSQSGISQSRFPIGLELGISITQFPSKNIVNESWITRTTKTNPIISPLVGISKEWPFKKHLQLITGLQYQMAGYRSYTYNNDNTKVWETFKIHKICLPILLGYRFNKSKINPTLYLGFRPNINLSGYISTKYRSDFIYVENELNLFEKDEYFIPPKRIINQFCIGLSTSVIKHIRINISCNIGHNYYKEKHIYRGNYSTTTWWENISIPGCDYAFSVTYILFKKDGSP